MQAQAQALLQDGFVLLHECFEPNTVCRKIEDICGAHNYKSVSRIFEDEDLALGQSRTNFRITNRKDGTLMSPKLHKLLQEIGNGHYSWYDSSIITALPGLGRQPRHRDYSRPESPDGTWKIVVFTPKTNVQVNGGETVVYRGTHLHDVFGVRGKRIRLAAGDAMVFFSSLEHYGGANETNEPRMLWSQTFEVKGLKS